MQKLKIFYSTRDCQDFFVEDWSGEISDMLKLEPSIRVRADFLCKLYRDRDVVVKVSRDVGLEVWHFGTAHKLGWEKGVQLIELLKAEVKYPSTEQEAFGT